MNELLFGVWLIGYMFTAGFTGKMNDEMTKNWCIVVITSLVLWPLFLGEYLNYLHDPYEEITTDEE